MGTTVSSLQILGATEDAVQAVLPKAIVGKWSDRFITACLDELFFEQLDRKAGWLSRKLDCTVLSVSMFDGDDLSLVLYVSGKRTARHVVDLEREERVLGNTNAFCAGLGLPPRLAPLLKRLFAEEDQEEKLKILSSLLGAPLFVRWDDDFSDVESQPADEGPLHAWIEAHPLPPKLKNQTRMELVQEIRERDLNNEFSVLILRHLGYADEEDARVFGCHVGDPCGYYRYGGEWAHWDQEGRLQLTPLTEDGLADLPYMDDISYVEADGRLLTFVTEKVEFDGPGCWVAGPTRVVFDSAGLLPLPLPLASTETPMTMIQGHLLSNGSFLAFMHPIRDTGCRMLLCYSAAGEVLWSWKGEIAHVKPLGDHIYLSTYSEDETILHCLTLAGRELCSKAMHSDGPAQTDGIYLYQMKPGPYRQDDTLLRFTLDLQEAGQLPVPFMSDPAISPDGTLLVCAGYGSGLMVIDLQKFEPRKVLHNGEKYYWTMVDGKNRIWAVGGGYIECWTPDLEPLSRHRIAGDVVSHTLNQAGEVCLATHQRNKYLTRVYRFYG